MPLFLKTQPLVFLSISIFGVLRYKAFPQKFTPELEKIGERNVFSALINNMTENTSYAIGIFYEGQIQTVKIYRTLPDGIDENDSFVIVSGGDVGNSPEAKKMTLNLVKYKPSAIFIG